MVVKVLLAAAVIKHLLCATQGDNYSAYIGSYDLQQSYEGSKVPDEKLKAQSI